MTDEQLNLADELEFHSNMQCIPEGTSAIMRSAARALRALSHPAAPPPATQGDDK